MSRLLKIGDVIDASDIADDRGPMAVPMPQRWYLLRVHPNRELKVMRSFTQRNISAYCPMLTRSVRINRTQRRDVPAPLFPGIILLPDFEWGNARLRTVDGVIGLLQLGPCTAYLSAELLADVRAIEASSNVPLAKRERLFGLGQIVRVVDGPFSGWQGRIERLDSKGRIRVLVEASKRGHKVQLTESQIEPVSHATATRMVRR